ncbi:MAG TPA: O-antigen ligase family protein, partial [Thermoleophilaceae bacterium]
MRSISAGRLGNALLLALPALLIVYFAFRGGGYFAGSTATAAVLVWVAFALRMVIADRPVAGFSRPLVAAAAALALLAVWALVSTAWSDSAARGLIEFDRALLYLGLLLLFGSLPRTTEQLDWALRGLLLAMVTVGAFALLSRVLPDVVTISNDIAADRLSYPLTYWNALGLLLGIGLILALHFASSEREPGWMRVAGAGATPVLASGLYLTLSRGAIAVTAAGVVAYLLLGRPRGALAGLLAVAPACVLAVMAAYDADLLTTKMPTTAAAVEQGKDAARVIGLSVLLALAVRLAGLLLDRRLARIRVAPRARRAAWAGTAGLVAVALAVSWSALDLGARVERQYDGFVNGNQVETGGNVRSRLTEPGNNGRLDSWQAALDAFEREPLLGTGAGTYGITWARERPITLKAEDAHSLYIELLSELGLPGLLLTLAAVVLVLLAFARGLSGPD